MTHAEADDQFRREFAERFAGAIKALADHLGRRPTRAELDLTGQYVVRFTIESMVSDFDLTPDELVWTADGVRIIREEIDRLVNAEAAESVN